MDTLDTIFSGFCYTKMIFGADENFVFAFTFELLFFVHAIVFWSFVDLGLSSSSARFIPEILNTSKSIKCTRIKIEKLPSIVASLISEFRIYRNKCICKIYYRNICREQSEIPNPWQILVHAVYNVFLEFPSFRISFDNFSVRFRAR